MHVTKLDFQNKSFEIVFMLEVLEHIADSAFSRRLFFGKRIKLKGLSPKSNPQINTSRIPSCKQ